MINSHITFSALGLLLVPAFLVGCYQEPREGSSPTQTLPVVTTIIPTTTTAAEPDIPVAPPSSNSPKINVPDPIDDEVVLAGTGRDTPPLINLGPGTYQIDVTVEQNLDSDGEHGYFLVLATGLRKSLLIGTATVDKGEWATVVDVRSGQNGDLTPGALLFNVQAQQSAVWEILVDPLYLNLP